VTRHAKATREDLASQGWEVKLTRLDSLWYNQNLRPRRPVDGPRRHSSSLHSPQFRRRPFPGRQVNTTASGKLAAVNSGIELWKDSTMPRPRYKINSVDRCPAKTGHDHGWILLGQPGQA
jgi:hypothetical protein